jgi:hypothetical protein
VVRHGGHLVVAGSTAGFNMFLTLKPRSEKNALWPPWTLVFFWGGHMEIWQNMVDYRNFGGAQLMVYFDTWPSDLGDEASSGQSCLTWQFFFFSMSWVNIHVYCVYIYIIYNISYHIYIIYI